MQTDKVFFASFFFRKKKNLPAFLADAVALRHMENAEWRTRRTWHLLRKDWFFSANIPAGEDSESVLDWFTLRRIRRPRARLGWLLRCDRAEGMSLSGQRALAPCPMQAARTPQWRLHAPIHRESVPKTPPPAAKMHARSIASPAG